jgi:hypothetical protein
MKNNEQVEEDILYAESIYGAKHKRGFVKLSHGITWEIILSANEARLFALSVLEAAKSTESDELLMEWLKRKIGISDESKMVAMLRDFRKMRVELHQRDLDEAKEENL